MNHFETKVIKIASYHRTTHNSFRAMKALLAVLLLTVGCSDVVAPSTSPKNRIENLRGTWEIYKTGWQDKHTSQITTNDSIVSIGSATYKVSYADSTYIYAKNGMMNVMFRPLTENSMMINYGEPYYNYDSTWIAVRKQ